MRCNFFVDVTGGSLRLLGVCDRHDHRHRHGRHPDPHEDRFPPGGGHQRGDHGATRLLLEPYILQAPDFQVQTVWSYQAFDERVLM